MDSPLMYDLPQKTSAAKLKVKCSSLQVPGNPSELPDLNTPEVSFDLHGFIKVKEFRRPAPVVLEDPETLLADILSEDSKTNSPEVISRKKDIDQQTVFHTINIPGLNLTSHMPHSSGQISDRYASEAGSRIKQEPASSKSFSSNSLLFAGFPQLPGSGIFADGGESSSSQGLDNGDSDARVSSKSSKSGKKNLDKESEEYRRRRERNNIAVRKSREKAKQKSKDTEKRVYELVSENDKIRKRVELLNRELSVLKGLLANFDASIEGFNNEMDIAKL